MKKRKFIIWLNIVTICLSICAIAIGVYSITTATLNVNGAIGFIAHECNVDIVASMYGDSAESDSSTAASKASGVLRSEANAKEYGKIVVYRSTQALDLGSLYFYKTENGKISPITLSFSITNKSAYNYIDVKVNQDCISDISDNRIFIYAPNNGETLAPRETITITIQLQLQKDSTGNYSNLGSALNLSNTTLLNFEKSQAPAYLATDWKDKINTFNTDAFSSATSISFLNKIDDTILNGFDKTVSVGAVDEKSNAGNLTTSVTDVVAYYHSADKKIIIYSPARIYAPQNCGKMFMFAGFSANTTLMNLDLSNFDTSKVTDMVYMFYNCGALTSLKLSNFDTSSVTSMGGMFANCGALTSLKLSNFDTSKVTSMASMFYSCGALTSLDVSNFNTSNVISMASMFYGCGALTSLDVSNFNTSSVTNMSSMFGVCSKLTSLDVSNFNTSNVTNMNSTFSGCKALTSLDLRNFDTSKVIDMAYMFSGCSKLTSLDVSNFDTSKVTNMRYMFRVCEKLTSLDLRNFDTSIVTDMSYMFSGCSGLTSLNLSNFNTSIVKDMSHIFEKCEVLTSLDLSNFNTSKVKNMSNMFDSCSALEKIYVNSTNWKTDIVTSSSYMFKDCTNLVGGAGTTFDSSKIDKTYARIDGSSDANGNVLKGYLTDIEAKPTV